jgi:biopolymer transport protein ExbB
MHTPMFPNLLAAAPPSALSPTSPILEDLSLFDLALKGGIVMIPIGLCSLIMLAVVAERAIQLRRRRVLPPSFLPGLRKILRDPTHDRDAALAYCRKRGGPAGRVFAVAVRRLGEPEESLERHIAEAGQREIPLLRKRLRVLAVIASVATLLGLLGTIFGMIKAFQTVAASAEALGRTELLARGIYEAMITTAAGLIVAIPSVIAYHWLAARADALVTALDRAAAEFVEEFGRRPAATAPPPPVVVTPSPTANGAASPVRHAAR